MSEPDELLAPEEPAVPSVKKERIWEIDALRGFMILCMIVVHTLFALEMFDVLTLPVFWVTVFSRAGVLFVILSGISATLGSRSFRRGILVFCGGLFLELGSSIAVALGFLDSSMVIRFGVLHLLGFCMMVWPLLKNFKPVWLLLMGAVIIVLGYWFETFTVTPRFLYALGLQAPDFSSGDYFPIFPQLGWFLVGGAFGKLLYPEKKSLLPKVNANVWPLRFLRFCGRNSLWIFLPHLPIIYGIIALCDSIF